MIIQFKTSACGRTQESLILGRKTLKTILQKISYLTVVDEQIEKAEYSTEIDEITVTIKFDK